MSYLLIKDFKGGLDTRRDVLTSVPGTLSTLNNAHVTRGGDIEKRKAFKIDRVIGPNTFGYELVGGEHFVFGSIVDPGFLNVSYQRLQHPDALAMTSLIASTVFNGKIFAVAEYTGGVRLAFYDTVALTDFYAGTVRDGHSNLDAVATELSALIDAEVDYESSADGAVISVSGPIGESYTITVSTTEVGGTDDQTIADITEVDAVVNINPVEAAGELEISGTAGATIETVKVSAVTIFSGTVNWTGSDRNTASLLAEQINLYVPTTGEVSSITVTDSGVYTVAPTGVTISAPDIPGTTATAHVVVRQLWNNRWIVTDVIVDTAGAGYTTDPTITITGGTAYVKSSVSKDASATATILTPGVSDPTLFTAVAMGSRVRITAGSETGTAANGLAVTAEVNSTATQSDPPNITLTTISNMVGGVDREIGVSQQSEITLGGTKDDGDVFSISITNDTSGVFKKFCGKRTAGISPTLAKAFNKKVYIATADGVYFPKINDLTEWEDDDLGSGVISVTNHAYGSQEVKAIGIYSNNLAFFTENNIQIWFIDPDPNLNSQVQTLDNVGTFAPLGVQRIGDIDVLFPSHSGIRSLRARDSSNSATVSDIGTPIDEVITDAIRNASAAELAAASSIVDPVDGRYWLHLAGTIYVLSWFRSNGVAAWSTYDTNYDPGFGTLQSVGDIEKFCIDGNRIYFRAGLNIYSYGGTDNDTYDISPVTVEMPYLDADKPAHRKEFTGIDIACSGLWELSYNVNPDDNAQWGLIGNYSDSTYHRDTQGFTTHGSHLRLKATTADESVARLSNIAIHFDSQDAS